MTHAYQIRRAVPGEASLLSELAYAAKKHWGYPDEWLESWADQLTLSPAYITAGQVYAATDVHKKPIACYAIAAGRDYAELDHFWVHPNHFGKGLGRAMFLHAVEAARALGFSIIFIDSDPNAEGFYTRMGAERIATIPADVCGVKRVLPRLHFDVRRRRSP